MIVMFVDRRNSRIVDCNLKIMSAKNSDNQDVVCKTCQKAVRKCENWMENLTISSDDEETASGHSESYELNENEHCQDLKESSPLKTIDKLNLNKCKHIHLGNVININGPVYLADSLSVTNEHSVTNQIFLDFPPPELLGDLRIVSRSNWLALPPMKEPTPLETPAKFVVICHTVSQPEEDTQAANTHLIRTIQKYHFTKRHYDDISYNFLIGTDGNIYEGRGWRIEGQFSKKYKQVAMGISFVGYYEEKLPFEESLSQAHALIRHGVEIGAVDENYSLLAHCQCSATESPGERLYFEIRRWDRWDYKIDMQHPSPFVAPN